MFRSGESLSLLITAVSGIMLAIAVVTADRTYSRESGLAQSSGTLDVSTGIPLDAIEDPATALAAMPVQTSNGEQIGQVRSVKLSPNGAVRTVTIATRGLFGLATVTATMNADDLVYLRDRKALVSRLTPTEIATKAGLRPKARL